MAISYVASTRSPTTFPAGSNLTSTCIINKPTGTVSGDVMLVFLESFLDTTFTLPSGWALISSGNYQRDASSMTSGIAYKVAGGSEGSSYTFTDDGGDGPPLCGMIVTYRGVDTAAPINAVGNTDQASADTQAAPTVVSTALGTYVWFRVGKTSTVLSEGDFAITGGTPRQKTSNRGAGTQYFVEAADSNGDLAVGSNAGASFNADVTLTGSIERTVVLKAAPEGSASATLAAVTSTFDGTHQIDATVSATLAPVTSAFAGAHLIDVDGTLAGSLAPVTSAFAGTHVGGSMGATLPSITSDWVGGQSHGSMAASLAPVVADMAAGIIHGSFAATLAPVSAQFESETVPFGEHVIRVEIEDRAFRVTDDGTGLVDIKRSQVTEL